MTFTLITDTACAGTLTQLFIGATIVTALTVMRRER